MIKTSKSCQVLANMYLVWTEIPLAGQEFYFPKPGEMCQLLQLKGGGEKAILAVASY